MAIGSTAATAFLPLLFPLLVDEVLLGQPGSLLALLHGTFPESWHGPMLYVGAVLAATLLLRFVGLGLGVWQTRLFTEISKDVTLRIRSALLRRLRRVSMSELETLGSGRVTSHLVVDLGTVETYVGSTASRAVMSVFTVLIVGLILLWLHWQLALFILIFNPIILLFSSIFGALVKDLKKRESSALAVFQEALKETMDAVQQIRASNREGSYFSTLIERAREVKERSYDFGWKTQAVTKVSRLVYLFGFDVFRGAAILMVVFSDLTVGEVFAIFSYLWYMMTPVQELIGLQYAHYGASGALERINRLHRLGFEPEYPKLENPFLHRESVSIRVAGLRFAYGRGPDVLKGIDLEIDAGERVAFVGASGGGKSTLVQALLGLYPPKAGTIYFQGVPVDRIGLDVVRDHVATVLQRPAMLNASIRDNLCLGREHADRELWHALELAQIRELVEGLDQGLDTVVGIQATRLSGGQRQRLAIARMVLADPRVMILDEATSAIDLETEERLFDRL
ncbi:MAG: ABC transporter ATP-binding protein/permease, partial [Holophagales bacterium]|nr:ABC transporter ATP-binding protein/permease [Holophagales bacterium]